MATRIHREIHDVEQTKKVIPFHILRNFLSSEFCELVFGVNKFDLDLGFQIDSVKQPIKSNPVGAGHVYHRWTSSFNYQFDHGFIVFKNVQLRLIL